MLVVVSGDCARPGLRAALWPSPLTSLSPCGFAHGKQPVGLVSGGKERVKSS